MLDLDLETQETYKRIFLVGNWSGTCLVIFVDKVLLGYWSGGSWGFVLSNFLDGKNKYWGIYLTVSEFWTGQIFPKILYTFYKRSLELHRKK